jgi:hypothetical protein
MDENEACIRGSIPAEFGTEVEPATLREASLSEQPLLFLDANMHEVSVA